MSDCKLDHLVIAANSIDEGVAYVQRKFGLSVPVGGEHKSMATHNHLMQLGGDTFLEIISRSPSLENNPERVLQPRWFGLDDAALQQKLEVSPRLLTWVVNTDNLEKTAGRCQFSLGQITAVKRGNLNWLFGLPSDGRLLGAGALPYVMQWQTSEHPSRAMEDFGVKLESLTVRHQYPDWLSARLEELGARQIVDVVPVAAGEQPGISAVFQVPDTDAPGEVTTVTLDSEG